MRSFSWMIRIQVIIFVKWNKHLSVVTFIGLASEACYLRKSANRFSKIRILVPVVGLLQFRERQCFLSSALLGWRASISAWSIESGVAKQGQELERYVILYQFIQPNPAVRLSLIHWVSIFWSHRHIQDTQLIVLEDWSFPSLCDATWHCQSS